MDLKEFEKNVYSGSSAKKVQNDQSYESLESHITKFDTEEISINFERKTIFEKEFKILNFIETGQFEQALYELNEFTVPTIKKEDSEDFVKLNLVSYCKNLSEVLISSKGLGDLAKVQFINPWIEDIKFINNIIRKNNYENLEADLILKIEAALDVLNK